MAIGAVFGLGLVLVTTTPDLAASLHIGTLRHAQPPLFTPVKLDRAELEHLLQDRGYNRVEVVARKRSTDVVEACQGNERYRIQVDKDGRITSTARVGTCRKAAADERARGASIGAGEIEPLLRARGYTAVRILDRKAPSYRAEACRGGSRFDLSLTRTGEIAQRTEIGECDIAAKESLKAEELTDYLRSRGFNRIKVVDAKRPRYAAEACKANDRYRLVVDRSGTIFDSRRLGACDEKAEERLGAAEVRDILRRRSYEDVRIVSDSREKFVAEGCRNVRRFRIEFNKWGEIVKRERVGWCSVDTARASGVVVVSRRISKRELDRDKRISAQDCQDNFESLTEGTSVLFETGSADVKSDSLTLLERIARLLKRCPRVQVEVAGHTDADGSAQANLELSEARARAVAKVLSERGIAQSRLEAIGYGDKRPIAANTSAVNKALNRRIEFVLAWQE